MARIGGAREVISDLSSSVGVADATLKPTEGPAAGLKIYEMVVQARTKEVYVAWDGAAADNSGMLLKPGDLATVTGYHLCEAFRAIEAEASASLVIMPVYIR